jgi:hypothetical protein
MKIFGLGLSRTGTTSLTKGLQILGYNALHFPGIFSYKSGQLLPNFLISDQYDALTDTPVVRFYKELDTHYPDSKFIITIREKEAWLESCRKYFYPGRFSKDSMPLSFLSSEVIYQLHMDIYGANEFKYEIFSKAYDRHYADVTAYFKGREDDLLVLDICDKTPDSWQKICTFLNKSVPNKSFPSLNKS